MIEARADVLAVIHFLYQQGRKAWNTKQLESVYQGIERLTRVVCSFHNDTAITLQRGAVLLKQNEDW